MFSDYGTFIIAFSVSKEHIAVAPEAAVIGVFEKEIKEAGHSHTNNYSESNGRITWILICCIK